MVMVINQDTEIMVVINNSYRKNYNRYDENKDVVLDETKNATDGE